MTFHNTIHLTGDELAQATFTTACQDDAVMKIMGEGVALTPSQVWEIGKWRGRDWLLTSVRRSMSNLSEACALTKLDELRPGPYGKPEHVWVKP